MVIDWSLLINWIVQALISFIFGGLGAFVAFRFSIELEKRKEEREHRRIIREQIQGGKIPPASIEQAVKLGKEITIKLAENPFYNISVKLPKGLLITKNGQEEGKTYALYSQKNYIGTGETANIRLSASNVAEKHACISCENNLCAITDLESASGTFVNGERISEITPINDNDEILIGDVALIYKVT